MLHGESRPHLLKIQVSSIEGKCVEVLSVVIGKWDVDGEYHHCLPVEGYESLI